MATLNVIRRWALRENMSIREISRRTGMARNTVKKYLRSDETEPTYAKRASSGELDPLCRKTGYLAGNGGKKIAKTAAQFEADLDSLYFLRWLYRVGIAILGLVTSMSCFRAARYYIRESTCWR